MPITLALQTMPTQGRLIMQGLDCMHQGLPELSDLLSVLSGRGDAVRLCPGPVAQSGKASGLIHWAGHKARPRAACAAAASASRCSTIAAQSAREAAVRRSSSSSAAVAARSPAYHCFLGPLPLCLSNDMPLGPSLALGLCRGPLASGGGRLAGGLLLEIRNFCISCCNLCLRRGWGHLSQSLPRSTLPLNLRPQG
jgi:hypothetical protein